MGTATSPATRATALFTADAIPASESSASEPELTDTEKTSPRTGSREASSIMTASRSRMQLEGAAEAEAERLLDRDVEEAHVLELARPAKRADVERTQPTVGDELRHLLLGSIVVARDHDVELLSADLARDERRSEWC